MYRRFLLCFAIAGGLGACSGAKEQGVFARPQGACAPGAEIACACPSGGTGMQACREDASGYGPCSFCSAPDSGAGEAGDPGFIGNPDDLLGMASCKAVDPDAHPALVEIVVDGSGSMASATKWAAAVSVANSLLDALATKKDATLAVGLMVFGDDKDPTNGNGPYPTRADVAVGAIDSARVKTMRDRLALTQPGGGTPMRAALEGSYDMLAALASPSTADAKRVVILFTDGTVASDVDETAVVQAVSVGAARGVTTLAAGVGPFPLADTIDYDAAFVGAVAKAGGAAAAICDPNETNDLSKLCQAQVTPGGGAAKDFAGAIDGALARVRRELSACEYALPAGTSPSKLNVVIQDRDGKKSVIRQSGANGWTLDDPSAPTKVTVHGTSCAKLENDRRADLSYLLECPTAK